MKGIGGGIPAPSPRLSCPGTSDDGEGTCGLEEDCMDLGYGNTPLSGIPLRDLDIILWRP